MHLVKWIRKNERKLMAWVVILLMIAFVGGSGLQQLLTYFSAGGSKRLIATYGDGKKIRATDYQEAQGQLEILRALMADRMLNVLSQINGDLGPNFLELILFPDARLSGELRMQLIQLAERGQLDLDREQIDQFFSPHPHRPEFLWMLLKAEARRAGCVVGEAEAAGYLRQMIAEITQNQLDASTLIAQLIQRTKQSESQIIGAFADLISIMNYADLVLGNYMVTSDEIRGAIARNMERLTAEFMPIDAQSLADEQPEPSAQQIQDQFNNYRQNLPGVYSEDNPYGFGYTLPKRIQVEYFLVNINDVRQRIDQPTPEELENFYSRNLSRYQKSEPIDPNDPDAGTRQVIQPFAQVAHQIRQDMERQKIENLSTLILNEARQMTEAGFDNIDFETASTAQLQQAAGDYVSAADQLRRKYEVAVYTGKTGFMRPSDIRNDLFLGRISIPTSTESTVRLMDLLLTIPDDGKPSSQPGLPAVRIWENISPLTSGLLSEDDEYVPLRGMIRVTDIRQPAVPDNVDIQFSRKGVTLTEPEEQEIFSVREQVIGDLKIRQAMDAARQKAVKLAELAENKGWDSGLETFYQTYYPNTDPNSPPSARPRLRTLPNQPILSQAQIEGLRQRLLSPSASTELIAGRYRNSLLIRKMAEQMDPDRQSTGPVALVLPFEQTRQVCVIKELNRQPATEKDYQENKNNFALQLAMLSKIDLGLIHFNPDNIAKRMQFQYVEQDEEPAATETDTEEQV